MSTLGISAPYAFYIGEDAFWHIAHTTNYLAACRVIVSAEVTAMRIPTYLLCKECYDHYHAIVFLSDYEAN